MVFPAGVFTPGAKINNQVIGEYFHDHPRSIPLSEAVPDGLETIEVHTAFLTDAVYNPHYGPGPFSASMVVGTSEVVVTEELVSATHGITDTGLFKGGSVVPVTMQVGALGDSSLTALYGGDVQVSLSSVVSSGESPAEKPTEPVGVLWWSLLWSSLGCRGGAFGGDVPGGGSCVGGVGV